MIERSKGAVAKADFEVVEVAPSGRARTPRFTLADFIAIAALAKLDQRGTVAFAHQLHAAALYHLSPGHMAHVFGDGVDSRRALKKLAGLSVELAELLPTINPHYRGLLMLALDEGVTLPKAKDLHGIAQVALRMSAGRGSGGPTLEKLGVEQATRMTIIAARSALALSGLESETAVESRIVGDWLRLIDPRLAGDDSKGPYRRLRRARLQLAGDPEQASRDKILLEQLTSLSMGQITPRP